MFKRLLIRVMIDFAALFVIFCGIDKLLDNEMAIVSNLLFAIIFSVLKNLIGLRKLYIKDLGLKDDEDKILR